MFGKKVIHVVDDRVDWSAGARGALWGPVIAISTFGEITMTSVNTMVDNVKTEIGTGRKMDILRIADHGNRDGLELGDDWITAVNFATYAPKFGELRSYFNNNGIAHFLNCLVGNNTGLLHQFAVTWNVTIYGGTGLTNGFRMNGGEWVSVTPGGVITQNVSWPD